jgi:hypothetical protein
MENDTMLELLLAREEDIRNTLRANDSLDKSSEACAETLDKALTETLLRYNASRADRRTQQALADGLTATARAAAGLVKAGRAEKKAAARQIETWAILLLLVSVILCTGAIMLAQKLPLASYVCMAVSVLLAYIGGRAWFKKGEVTVRPTVDADAVWQTLRQTVETMDRKLDELSACVESEAEKPAADGGGAFNAEEIKLLAGLLEALYAQNGEFALRQLAKVPDYMEDQGISLVEYSPETEHYFECFPSRRERATQRPAIMLGDKLLLMGKAIKQTETRR